MDEFDELEKAIEKIAEDVGLFSEHALGMPLRPYQLAPVRIITESVLQREGETFLLIFPRQSGKNEAVAHMLVYLLNMLQNKGGRMVFGAVGDGLGRAISRLEARLDNSWNRGRWQAKRGPVRRELGQASVAFLSTHPQAAARGETADRLLVIDELQEQDALHLEAVFEPMRAANNATALYLGTVKTTSDALWRMKGLLEARTAEDGRQRVFIVSPEEVAAVNEAYGRFLEQKVAQFGRQHPVVKSEYFNEPLDGKGGLFDERRLALMQGTHPRQRQPGFDYDEFDTSETLIQQSFNFDISRQASRQARPAARHEALNRRRSGIYVATLDVAGQDEAATDPLAAASQLALSNPGRDYTVAHLFELAPGTEEQPEPVYLAVDVFVDRGGRHFQAEAGRPQLAERLLAWLQGWEVAHLVADNSGVGAGLVDWLAARLGKERVTGYTFTRQSKAALGANFLAVVETGRFQYFASESEGDAADKFFAEAAACQYSLAAGGRFERDLRWGVWRGGHDDRLVSAALVAVYDELVREGKVMVGRAESAVIAPLAGPGDVLAVGNW